MNGAGSGDNDVPRTVCDDQTVFDRRIAIAAGAALYRATAIIFAFQAGEQHGVIGQMKLHTILQAQRTNQKPMPTRHDDTRCRAMCIRRIDRALNRRRVERDAVAHCSKAHHVEIAASRSGGGVTQRQVQQ